MYPEVTGEEHSKGKAKKAEMPGMQMPNDQSMAGMNMGTDNSDIVTLNYAMLRAPKKTTFMMRHPMHLHGHDFRLVNGQGEYAPMKNIIDIMPMERDTIEFAAREPGGDWFFH
eukprot:gene20390-24220_t